MDNCTDDGVVSIAGSDEDGLVSADGSEDNDSDGPNTCRGRTKSLTDERSQQIKKKLIKEGYKLHLQGVYGKVTRSRAIHQIIRQVAVYLSWVEQFHLQNQDQYSGWSMARKLCYIFDSDPKSIITFLSYMESRDCKAMTCHSYTNSIANCLMWLMVDFSSKYKLNRARVETVLKMCRRKYKKYNQVRQMTLGDTDTMVKERLWPATGIMGLQKPVEDRMAWAESLVIIFLNFVR